MRIHCLTRFLDKTVQFEKDDVCTVSDEEGAYFVGNGWAEDVSGQTPTGTTPDGNTDLVIQDGSHGHQSNIIA